MGRKKHFNTRILLVAALSIVFLAQSGVAFALPGVSAEIKRQERRVAWDSMTDEEKEAKKAEMEQRKAAKEAEMEQRKAAKEAEIGE